MPRPRRRLRASEIDKAVRNIRAHQLHAQLVAHISPLLALREQALGWNRTRDRSKASRSVQQLRPHQSAFDCVYFHLDLSNPHQLNGKIVGVFVEFSERCGDFYELFAVHRRSVAFEVGYFRSDFDKALVQTKALVSAGGAAALYRHRTTFRQ